MKKAKYLFAILFMLVAFLVIGATSVNAETTNLVNNLEQFKALMSNSDNVDVIKLNTDISATDTFYWNIKGDKTLDLNGFSINNTKDKMFKIFYYGDYTLNIINSSNSRGSINHETTAEYCMFELQAPNSGFTPNKTLIIDGVNLNEIGTRSEATSILNRKDNSVTDTLIVKNSVIKSNCLAQGFDRYEFSNVTLKPSYILTQTRLVAGNNSLLVENVLGANQELVYDKEVSSGNFTSTVADPSTKISEVITKNTYDITDNSIVVSAKAGFAVSDVELTETYGYADATAKEISIKNVSTSSLKIKNVIVDDNTHFNIVPGNMATLEAEATDTSWKIEAKDNLSKGEYTANIIVTADDNSTYTATVKLTVNPKTVDGLGIENINSTIIYGEEYEPTIVPADLETDDYKIKYSKKIGENYQNLANKPTDVGDYKVTVTITNENYVSSEASVFYSITPKTIDITVEDIPDEKYNGEEHTPNVIVKSGSIILKRNIDYTVTYEDHIRAGQAVATINPVDGSNYTFTATIKTFNINKYEIKASDVTLEYSSVVYDGNAKEPTVTVKMGNEVIEPIEYTVDYSANTNIGTAEVVIQIKIDSDDFTGTVTKTFEIVDKILLNISGISDQQVVYTGNPVELVGNLTVSNEIDPSILTVKWYKDSEEIDRPTNVGTYKVVYSYEDETYKGSLTVDFEITKKTSTVPFLNPYTASVGSKLSSISLPNGFKWVNEEETIIAGNKDYDATFTTNNDTTNYTTENITIGVYGKSRVDLITSVNGIGGTISAGKTSVLEGTTESITFAPETGYKIDKVTVNDVDKTASVVNNKLNVAIGDSDVTVVVTYKVIQYTITVRDFENGSISPEGPVKVDYNSEKKFTIIPELGYNLVSVKVNGVERISDVISNELTLKNITEDQEIVVVLERNTYKVIEGAGQKYIIGESNEAKFKISAEYSAFARGGSVYVDDELVDPSKYTSEEGSTVISLKKEFVDSLAVGEHTLKVLFTNGEANTTFTIEETVKQEQEQEQEQEISNPKTGDNIVMYVVIASVSILGIITTIVLKRNKK